MRSSTARLSKRMRRRVAILGLIGALVGLALLGAMRPAGAQDVSVSANLAVWKSSDGVAQICIELRDTISGQAREARQCPSRGRLTFAHAPEDRWLRSNAVEIGPEISVWARARRVGDRLDMALGLSIEGEARGLRTRSWNLDWPSAATDRWLRTSAINIALPAALHPELWPVDVGIAAGAARLEPGQPAPQFSLPLLGADADDLTSLSEARAKGTEVTLIVFWASWAPYVEDTLTSLVGLSQSNAGLQVIGVNAYEVDDQSARAVAQSYGTGLLHLVDADGSVAEHYRVDGLPEFFLLDSDGVYRAVVRGAAPMSEILATIAALN